MRNQKFLGKLAVLKSKYHNSTSRWRAHDGSIYRFHVDEIVMILKHCRVQREYTIMTRNGQFVKIYSEYFTKNLDKAMWKFNCMFVIV